MSTLPISPVRFIEDRTAGIHKYYKGFTELHGVTEILKEVIFYDKYQGIDSETLKNAANRGTAIHEIVQDYLMGKEHPLVFEFAEDAEKALKSWKRFAEGTGLFDLYKPDSVEYLVSDEKEIASKIDVVFKNEGYVLADIKTTSRFDEEYLSWQLSVYADLFRMQTGQRIECLLALWYDRTNDSWMAKEVKDKGHEEIVKLIEDWHNGVKRVVDTPAPILEVSKFYRDIELQIANLESQRNDFRTRLMEMMKEYGVKSVKLDGFSATYKEPTERKTFDTKKFQAAHPELDLSDFYKTSKVAESIMVRVGE